MGRFPIPARRAPKPLATLLQAVGVEWRTALTFNQAINEVGCCSPSAHGGWVASQHRDLVSLLVRGLLMLPVTLGS
ncbi:MAG: hypothetical protein OXI33_02550, partial [Chloroflexota bacterium]|nr:hypothetical protein [Chloroflexota bacterium]